MRYLLLGANGLLGGTFARILGAQAIVQDRSGVDITDSRRTENVVPSLRPDVVLNCTAYNFVDRAETEREAAWAVNAVAPGRLAEICARLDIAFVHFSTDYVFGNDVTPGRPIGEDAPTSPLSSYGQSKLAGEGAVLAAGGRSLIVRTAGLFGSRTSAGGKSSSFVDRVREKVRLGEPLRVVADQVVSPTYAPDLAAATLELLRLRQAGLFHVTNGGHCSWFELAGEVARLMGVDANITPIKSAELGAPARRPQWSVLDCQRLQSLGLPPLRPWQAALAEYLTKSLAN